jgi:putative phosphoesterase
MTHPGRLGAVMKVNIGVLSDTHLNSVTGVLKGIYDQFLGDVDVILHAGDFVSEEIVTFLRQKPFHGVYGNTDPAGIKKQLPEKRIIEFGCYRVGLIHGTGPKGDLQDRVRAEFKDVDVIVFGHSHQPENQKKNGVLLFNPGTAAGYTPSGFNSIGILRLDDTIRGEIIKL